MRLNKTLNILKALLTCPLVLRFALQIQMAEKEGFEPPVPFQVQLISSQSHSATLPLLLKVGQESRV